MEEINNTENTQEQVQEQVKDEVVEEVIENAVKENESETLKDKKLIDISPTAKVRGVLGAPPVIPAEDIRSLRMYTIAYKFLSDIDLNAEETKEIEQNQEQYKAFIDMLSSKKLDINSLFYRQASVDKLDFNKESVNGMVYGDKEIGIFNAPLKKANYENHIQAFKAALRGTSLKYISLIHSGFTIQITPPSLQDMIILQQTLHSEEVALAKDTASLVNSSKRSYLIDNIVTFIRSLIVKHPLILEDNDDIFNHISVLDYDLILAGILSAGCGSSINLNYRCANTYVYNDELKKYECDVEFPIDVNLDKMLFIEDNYLPKDSIKTLAYRDKNTLTMLELKEYRREMESRLGNLNTFRYKFANSELVIKLKVPSINKFVVDSTEFIQDIKQKVSEANTPENEYKENKLVKRLLNVSEVSDLTSIIEEMETTLPDGTKSIINKPKLIQEVIDDMMDDEFAKKLYKHIEEYLTLATVAKICYPRSYCSKCREKMKKDVDTTGSLKDLVPVNMLGFFYQAINILN